ncbi:MAG: hypothetical protein V9G19_21875 [Tetrasphaera sp.]
MATEHTWLDSLGQIDFYDDPALIAAAADAAVRLFDNRGHHLAVAALSGGILLSRGR